jgi:hypothetical protein
VEEAAGASFRTRRVHSQNVRLPLLLHSSQLHLRQVAVMLLHRCSVVACLTSYYRRGSPAALPARLIRPLDA